MFHRLHERFGSVAVTTRDLRETFALKYRRNMIQDCPNEHCYSKV